MFREDINGLRAFAVISVVIFHFYPIDIVASTSFAIYFIHPFIPATILMLKIECLKLNSWFVFILFITLVTVFCVFIAIFTKKLLPKYSKYITGY